VVKGKEMITWNEFVEITERNFRFLETKFGFELTSTEEPFLRYRSPFIEIEIYYQLGRHHELDLGIQPHKKIDKFERSYSIGMLIRVKDPKGPYNDYMSPFPKTKDEVEFSVKELAHLLSKYGTDLLRGDMNDIQRMQDIEDKWGKTSNSPTN
jgi:hypothetical protein